MKIRFNAKVAIKIAISIVLSYSRSYIQPDDGYICIAETCIYFYIMIQVCTDCSPNSLLYTHILEHMGYLPSKIVVMSFVPK
jgi:hypothetical protein